MATTASVSADDLVGTELLGDLLVDIIGCA